MGAAKRYRPAPTRAITATELAEAGWELVEYVPVSRAFSDKALFLARRA